MRIGCRDQHIDKLADDQLAIRLVRRLDIHHTINLRRISSTATDTAAAIERIDEHTHSLANLGLQALFRYPFLQFHHTPTAVFAYLIRHLTGQIIGTGTIDRRIGKAAEAVDLRFAQEIEQIGEFFFGLTGKAGNEGRAYRNFRTHFTPSTDTFDIFFTTGRPLHALQYIGMRMLQRHIEIRQDMAIIHEWDNVIDMRIRVNIMQTNPGIIAFSQLTQGFDQLRHMRLEWFAIPKAGTELDVDAIGTGILRNDEQFLDPGFEQIFRFQHDFGDRPRHQVATHRWNDAKTAAMIAAF